MSKVPITVMGHRCERCTHQWIPKGEREPTVCPRCKSPYWNRPKKSSEGHRPGNPVDLADRFWHPLSFEELAAEQGVDPAKTWDEIVGGWPEGADFKEFLEGIRRAREE